MTRHTRASTGHGDSRGTESTDGSTAMTRRSHRKSRNGCIECKRRHIRCDERQPLCANCEVADRTCSFPPPKVSKRKQRQVQQCLAEQQPEQPPEQPPEVTATLSPGSEMSGHSNANNIDNVDVHVDADHAQMPSLVPHQQENRLNPGQAPSLPPQPLARGQTSLPSITGLDTNPHQIPSPASPMQVNDAYSPSANCLPGLPSGLDLVSEPTYTPQHMILLHHAATVPNFIGPNRSVVDIAIRRAVDSPYLIDEVLAFTAFHLAYLYPGSAVYLRHLATELQNRALTSFTHLTEMVPNDDKATAVPRFLFSAILGRHVLADTLVHYRSDFHLLIDRFVECFNLNRGIRAVTPPARDYLYDSEIRPFLNVILEAQSRITSPGTECDPLNRLVEDADLSEASANACRQAIEVLQWSFDICHGLDEEEYPQSASAFSVRIEGGFVDMLRKHRPEALVILAYYGVLLHRCRSFWAFGDAGASIIRSIAGHLGSYWQEALTWPLYVLETGHNSRPITMSSRCGTVTMSSVTPT